MMISLTFADSAHHVADNGYPLARAGVRAGGPSVVHVKDPATRDCDIRWQTLRFPWEAVSASACSGVVREPEDPVTH
jgi:hypothetical protein